MEEILEPAKWVFFITCCLIFIFNLYHMVMEWIDDKRFDEEMKEQPQHKAISHTESKFIDLLKEDLATHEKKYGKAAKNWMNERVVINPTPIKYIPKINVLWPSSVNVFGRPINQRHSNLN